MSKMPLYGDVPDFIKKLNIEPFKSVRQIAHDFTGVAHDLIKFAKEKNDQRNILALLVNNSVQDGAHSQQQQQQQDTESAEQHLPHSYTAGELNADELVSNVWLMLFAGFETTAKTLAFSLYLLAKNKIIQRKAQKTVDSLLAGSVPEYKDLNKLEYIQYIAKEALRLYPTVPAYLRITTEEFEFENKVIPKDTVCLYNFYGIHRNKEFYGDDADKFMPDRWYTIDLTGPNSFMFTPFGLGVRSCLGKKFAEIEMCIVLTMILQRYNIVFADDKDYDNELAVQCNITLSPVRPILVRLIPRKQ